MREGCIEHERGGFGYDGTVGEGLGAERGVEMGGGAALFGVLGAQ